MNPFHVLGLEPGVTREVAKARYRELVKTHHPDVGGDAETFKRIQRAWEMVNGRRSVQARPVRRPRPWTPPTVTMVFGMGEVTITINRSSTATTNRP